MQELKLSNVFISILIHFPTDEWVVYETAFLLLCASNFLGIKMLFPPCFRRWRLDCMIRYLWVEIG